MTNVQVSVTQLDAVGRITLPLATGPRHVHCYLVDGTLFDTGIGLEPPPWRELGIERIAITHFHPDHVGGAEAAAAESGAAVYQGGARLRAVRARLGLDGLAGANRRLVRHARRPRVDHRAS